MNEDESAVVSIYFGSDVTEDDANKLAAEIQELYPDVEVMAFNGGQPYYYYVFSVE